MKRERRLACFEMSHLADDFVTGNVIDYPILDSKVSDFLNRINSLSESFRKFWFANQPAQPGNRLRQ